MKTPNLRHCWACSQNKGLSKYQRRASQLRTSSFHAGDREAGEGQPEPERGNLGPRKASSTKLQTGPQLLVKTSWDSGRLTSAQRVAARDQLPQHTRCHPGNGAVGTGEVIRCTGHLERLRSPSTWSPELLRPGKGTKRRCNRICASVEYPRTWT